MFDVAIIGAGPVGLAAAIEAKRQGLSYVVLEKGCVVNAIFEYPTYMTFFTTSERLEIGEHPFVTSTEKATRKEALSYYRLVSAREQLNVRQYSEVIEIHPAPAGFTLVVEAKSGDTEAVECRYCVVATGYFDHPNRLGIKGDDLENVAYGYTEAHPFWGLNVTVIGGGNSAADAALDLYRHGAKVTLVHRGKDIKNTIKYWMKPDLENRIKEGSIKAYFSSTAQEITHEYVLLKTAQGMHKLPTDFTFVLIGYTPNTKLFEMAGVKPDQDSRIRVRPTFETEDVQGLYAIGSCYAGRFTGQVFIENGKLDAKQAIADIAQKCQAR
ncbi:MAG: YpdA family putative bacillithiol disulfide reductase [Deinococcales bacterium]